MKNIYIVDYAFLKYYSKFSDKKIDIKNNHDREELVTNILINSNIDWKNNFEEFKPLIKEFYEAEKYDSKSITCEILTLIRTYLKPGTTEKISDELRDVLVDLVEKIANAWNLEIYDEFEKSSKIWIELLGDEFPICDEKLVEKSFLDKESPYYVNCK